MQAHLFVNFLRAGEKSGRVINAEVEKFIRQHGVMPSHFTSLNEYLSARDSDYGVVLVSLIFIITDDISSNVFCRFGLAVLCCGVEPPVSPDIITNAHFSHAIHLGMSMITLCNDYWSWVMGEGRCPEKETR